MSSNSNRSPSPVFARPNQNLRATELNNPIRRSFTGSPFNKPLIPSNPRSTNTLTPDSDIGRKNFLDRNGGLFYNTKEKENEKDQILKTAKTRSPKVSKNFMAPTISRASKIASASPRKIVLTDRNEPTRNSSSSVNFFDGMENHESKPKIESNLKKIDRSVDSKETPNSNEIKSSKSSVDGDLLYSRFVISPNPGPDSSCPIIAPIDADPVVAPPYDPKTNYLSPRPQFLHYRPNPRVTFNLDEEVITFESLSDSETSEEAESEELIIETEDHLSVEKKLDDSDPISTQLPIMVCVSEEVAIEANEETESEEYLIKACESEEVISEATEVTESEVYLKETEYGSLTGKEIDDSDPISINVDTKTDESKGVLKKQFFSRLKPISLLLMMMVVACLSISLIDAPLMDIPQLKDHVFWKIYGVYEIMEHSKENYDGVARKFSFWSANCINYFTKLIHLPKTEQKLSDLPFFYNSTSIEDNSYSEIEEFVNGDVFTSQNGLFLDWQVTIGEGHGHIEIKEFVNEDVIELSEVENLDELENPVVLSSETELTEDKIFETENGGEVESDNKIQELISIDYEDLDDELKEPLILYTENNHQTEEISDNSKSMMSSDRYEIPTNLETSYSTNNNPEAKFSSVTTVLGISSLSTALIIAATFLAAKQRKSYEPNEMATKKANSSAGWKHNEISCSMSSSEPCQSEMSSFEAQSIERRRKIKRNLRRESLATSSDISISMDSASYGSFTTYEILQRKHADDEERVVTPVRRSSRIRSHVTSP